jgi:predicted aspartyl protease
MTFLVRRRHYEDDAMGQIYTFVTVTNPFDPSKRIEFKALVDTGAFGLTLPMSWKERLEPFTDIRPAEIELADQRRVAGEVAGPVGIQLQGFPRVWGEVVLMEVEHEDEFEPLVGCMVLEAANAAVDLLRHKLIKLPTYPLKPALVR